MTNKKRLALFPAGTIIRDLYHLKSPTRHEEDLNLRRTWVQALLKAFSVWSTIYQFEDGYYYILSYVSCWHIIIWYYTMKRKLKRFNKKFNCHKATEPLWVDSLLFTTKSRGEQTYLYDQPQNHERLCWPWSHTVV